MHPVTYDVTVRNQQLEIERATRKATLHAEALAMSARVQSHPRAENPLRRLAKLLTPRRMQRATIE